MPPFDCLVCVSPILAPIQNQLFSIFNTKVTCVFLFSRVATEEEDRLQEEEQQLVLLLLLGEKADSYKLKPDICVPFD